MVEAMKKIPFLGLIASLFIVSACNDHSSLKEIYSHLQFWRTSADDRINKNPIRQFLQITEIVSQPTQQFDRFLKSNVNRFSMMDKNEQQGIISREIQQLISEAEEQLDNIKSPDPDLRDYITLAKHYLNHKKELNLIEIPGQELNKEPGVHLTAALISSKNIEIQYTRTTAMLYQKYVEAAPEGLLKEYLRQGQLFLSLASKILSLTQEEWQAKLEDAKLENIMVHKATKESAIAEIDKALSTLNSYTFKDKDLQAHAQAWTKAWTLAKKRYQLQLQILAAKANNQPTSELEKNVAQIEKVRQSSAAQGLLLSQKLIDRFLKDKKLEEMSLKKMTSLSASSALSHEEKEIQAFLETRKQLRISDNTFWDFVDSKSKKIISEPKLKIEEKLAQIEAPANQATVEQQQALTRLKKYPTLKKSLEETVALLQEQHALYLLRVKKQLQENLDAGLEATIEQREKEITTKKMKSDANLCNFYASETSGPLQEYLQTQSFLENVMAKVESARPIKIQAQDSDSTQNQEENLLDFALAQDAALSAIQTLHPKDISLQQYIRASTQAQAAHLQETVFKIENLRKNILSPEKSNLLMQQQTALVRSKKEADEKRSLAELGLLNRFIYTPGLNVPKPNMPKK